MGKRRILSTGEARKLEKEGYYQQVWPESGKRRIQSTGVAREWEKEGYHQQVWLESGKKKDTINR